MTAKRKCKWCGSSKHRSQHCHTKAKLALLSQGVAPRDAGFIVLDCANVDEVADKIDAVHTLLGGDA